MVQFHPLIVTDIQKTIRDAVIVTLQPADGTTFPFKPGQYLTFRRNFEGEELRRSYSICSSPADPAVQVGIKKVPGGAFSTWANTELAVGNSIQSMPPMGNFYREDTADNPHLLAFAAGSGITPIISILRTSLDKDLSTRATLIYANRNPSTIMFKEELEELKNSYMDRFNIVHILSDESQEIDLFKGRIDDEKCTALFEKWIDITTITTAYICGPEQMMQTVAANLEQHGLPAEHIRFELFASAQKGRLKKPIVDSSTTDHGIKGQLKIDGEVRSLTIPPDTSLLDAALINNFNVPYACKAGVCSTCKAKVVEGDVEMVANHSLEDHEVEDGYVLTCQCFPVSSKSVIWDYDQSGH